MILSVLQKGKSLYLVLSTNMHVRSGQARPNFWGQMSHLKLVDGDNSLILKRKIDDTDWSILEEQERVYRTRRKSVQKSLDWVDERAEEGSFNTTLPPQDSWFDNENEALSCANFLSEAGYSTKIIKRWFLNEWRVFVSW